MKKAWTMLLLGGVVLAVVTAGGCASFPLGFFTPVPVPPWVAEHMEEKICNNMKPDYQTPVLPPIPAGYRPFCEDPPDEATILRAMPRVKRGVPYVFEEFRDDIDFSVERLVDTIDPPRFFPLIGPAQLHHCHYKCTVYYTETLESCYPFPFRCKQRRVQVVYIDRDHLHLVACTPEAQDSLMRDMSPLQP
jgi:hypothetical protein